jgi:iron complex outermembrane receptor protein
VAHAPVRRRFAYRWLAVPALLLLPLPLWAAQGRQITAVELLKLGFFQDFEELNLEELLGSGEIKTEIASGVEQILQDVPGAVSLVTAEEIQNRGARRLEDVLRMVPGFDVVTDSLGRSRIVVRGIVPGVGGGSDGVLVLFNGHPLNEDISGGATVVNLDLPMEHVKRVEVLRGPASALYGGGAFAGVVNIVTSDVEDFQGIGLYGGAGSFTTHRVGMRLGNQVAGVTISGFLHFTDSDGARLAIPADAQPSTISVAPGRTTDDYRSLETSYRLGFKDLSLNLRLKNENAGGFVGFGDSLGTQNDLNNRQTALDVGYRRTLGDAGSFRARIGYTQSEVRQLLEVLPPGFERMNPDGVLLSFPGGVFLQTSFNTRRHGAEAALDHRIGGHHHGTVGVSFDRVKTFDLDAKGNLDFRTMTASSGLQPLPGVTEDTQREILGLFAEDTWTPSPRIAVSAGLRFDHYDDVGDLTSPRGAVVLTLPRDLSLKLLYGRAFRAPSFSELHFNLPGYLANPDLLPSKVETLEAMLTYDARALRVSGTLFSSFVRDPIGTAGPASALAPRQLVNLPGVDVRGLELELRRNFNVSDSVFASFTHQQAEDSATGLRRADVPRELAALGATFNFRDRLSVTPSALFRSRRTRAPGDLRPPVDGYAIVNLHVRLRELMKTLEISGTLSNLFDVRYSDPSPLGGVPGDYPRPGRSVFIMATYRF